LPASNQIEFDELKLALGTANVNLLREDDFKDRFPDCESGAMPPFGNLYGMPVFVADSLAQDDYMAFSAGSHHEVVIMTYADYARLVNPRVVKFSAEILALPS
jgi:Ala-tRNA(Pro) deacylase